MREAGFEEWLGCIGGTAALAVGIQCFLEPASLVAGGITGIGIMLNQLAQRYWGLEIPLWLVNAALNFPLFLAAWKMQGAQFVGKTIGVSLLFSFMLFLVRDISFYSGDLILSALYGGALMGLGMGLVLRSGATTGGVDLAAWLLEGIWRRPALSGKIFLMDAAIILAGMIMFGGMRGLYAIVCVYIAERCTKWILEGTAAAQGAVVISAKGEEIGAALNERLGRTAAVFCGKGYDEATGKNALFCILSQKELQGAKSIIIHIDKHAILLLADIREVLGRQLNEK